MPWLNRFRKPKSAEPSVQPDLPDPPELVLVRSSFRQPAIHIVHSLHGAIILQRPRDGYINGEALSEIGGTAFWKYSRTKEAAALLKELGLRRPHVAWTEWITRGPEDFQGEWVHPQIAVHLGHWLSAEIGVQVVDWMLDWAAGNTAPMTSKHVKAYLRNKVRVPSSHFSMMNESYLHVWAPLEENGSDLPAKVMREITRGSIFAGFLRRRGVELSHLSPSYLHEFADPGRLPVGVALCPAEHLADFRYYLHNQWLAEKASSWMAVRLPKAEILLASLLQLPKA